MNLTPISNHYASHQMRAMLLRAPGRALEPALLPRPQPGPGQVLVKVSACGICRTDLHVVDGELREPVLPLVPGHQIVGLVQALGEGVRGLSLGQRIGVPWLGWTCGSCAYCRQGHENLCDRARFTGYQLPGGFAEYTLADARYCLPIPAGYPDLQAAPLLCAGLIGFQAWRMASPARSLGLYGFGAAAHLVIQLARHHNQRVYAFSRPGDAPAQAFARELGAAWAGDSTEAPPESLDAAIIFAPDGSLVPLALAALAKGGTVVCAGIHMSEIPSFDYALLWGERSLRSVANLTRADGIGFLQLAPQIPIHTRVQVYPLEAANQALDDLRRGRLQGAGVFRID